MWLTVHFVDVGQGDAIWINTADDGIDGNGIFEGTNIVIDGGPYSADTSNPVLPYIEDRGHHGAVIEALIMTHPHIDHYRGGESLSRHLEIKHFYDPGYPSTKSRYLSFLEAMRDGRTLNGVFEPPRAGVTHFGVQNFGDLDWGDEVEAKFLYSWPGSPTGLGSGNTVINNSSIVLRLKYGNHSFLFMGDAEGKDRHNNPSPSKYVEKILVEQFPASELKSTVLKIGHHGSETSSTTQFIQTVDPDVVVVQSGRKDFNTGPGTLFLPDDTTLQRYCCHNPATRIYRTDQNDGLDGLSESQAKDGDHIVIKTNGNEIVVEAQEGGQPFSANSCQPAC
jgi:competence protein ComEC